MSLDSSHPTKSGSNSKRSFNSTNSNNTGGNNYNKKKRKKDGDSGQQTLGMAWGSNSRSSSRSSFRSAPFTDVASYMAVKNRKLHEQFDVEASSSSHGGSGSKKPVFYGVSIFVDGYTVPSTQELRGYMLKHGGRFENYFSRQRVTHIICSNLPESKVKNLRSFSRGLPVVKPTWVLDCIAADKLLSWVPYQLEQIASEANNQPKLSTFLDSRNKNDSPNDPMTSDINTSEVSDSVEGVKQSNQGSDSQVYDSFNEAPSASEASRCSDIQNITESPSIVSDSSNKCHSTSLDPNFVETYFKNSRLHFIGTWRNRYRNRFPNSSKPSISINPSSSCQRNTIVHIDMDCFFVSVVIRNRPELWDKPVAVCHSDNPRGTSEISSANYPARDHGVRAGIFVRDAKALCPHLVIVPYNFEAYEEVADQFYRILHKHCNKVQAMSCDEAILDITDLEMEDPEILVSLIRKEISDTTGCTASGGISGNILMARLATRTAKPNGQCYLPPEKVNDFLKELPVKVLPGIGRALDEKLKGKHIQTCGDLRMISKETLRKDFGQKTGDMLWSYCRGIDNRLVGMIQESKSVGADVNWGVRFKDMKDTQSFLLSLCKEVSLRLHGCGVRGRTFTLKIKKRKTDEEPIKYMGCGDCDNFSHSLTVPMATDDVDVLQRITKQLFSHFHIDVKDIRGVGLHVTKLESSDNCTQGNGKSCIRSWLVSASATKEKENLKIINKKEKIDDHVHQSTSNSTMEVPPMSELDSQVLESLPPEILSEINDFYGGKLKSFISKRKSKTIEIETSSVFPGNVQGISDTVTVTPTDASTSQNIDTMPTSLSQIDASVLQELPEEIRNDIIDLLPPHRNPDSDSPLRDPPQTGQLWVGDPPQWVEKFRSSDIQILRLFSSTYSQLKSKRDLSSLLLKIISSSGELLLLLCNDDNGINWLCELLKQYIQLKLDSDLEEIHTCFRLLKRLSGKSEVLLQVYNITLPQLQMCVSEKYGGSLDI
ncbi:unnamed protein product [Lactuca saligna]|uniref:DNA repair protein REV1 n=1 Tax=Lactuca saligna TaxID=75948 RepID=A0AA35ZKW4_LACSI|nr:unnamed protein product [Lactuca saligna]